MCCQGFFRRMLKEQLHKKFICTNGENCEIASANRTNCKFCRFAKCLRVGMTLEGLYLADWNLCFMTYLGVLYRALQGSYTSVFFNLFFEAEPFAAILMGTARHS